MNYIVEDIGEVVEAIKVNGLPHYMYGHPTEIALRTSKRDTNVGDERIKYPLIALRMDASEELKSGLYHYNLNLIIVAFTSKTDYTDKRYETVFKPVLYPLFEKFMRSLVNIGKFTWDDQDDNEFPPHVKIDRPYYGTIGSQGNLSNLFNDPLDAIEIQNLKIKTRSKLCI